MRVKLSSLEKKEDRFFRADEPFFGVAYELDDLGEIIKLWNVINGRIVGPHDDDWPGKVRRLDVDRIEWDSEEDDADMLFDGEIISADCTLCEFDESGILTDEEESMFRRRQWDERGQLRELLLEIDIQESWRARGQIAGKSYGGQSYIFKENGTVGSIRARGDGTIGSWPHGDPLIAGKHLSLEGAITDSDLFGKISGLSGVKRLTLEATLITGKGLTAFLQCKNLRMITIIDNENFTNSEAKQIADSLPNCVVIDYGKAHRY